MTACAHATRRSIFDQAWPIILGQALVPTVGLVDAAVIGRTGDPVALGGVALGAAVVTLIFWAFGFLRMGMSGLSAQAVGASDRPEVEALLLRGLLVGFLLGLAVLALHPFILPMILHLMGAPAPVHAEGMAFATARMAGAPAALAGYAINGWLIGLGRTKSALLLQIVLNGANILFDILLVAGFGMGARGVGIGTAAAEWLTLGAGVAVALGVAGVGPRTLLTQSRHRLMERAALRRLFSVNADIMVRTLALLILFTWFTHAGARQGTTTLAANHILLQFVSLSAFVLDAFAFTAEARVGGAIGAGSREAFRRSVRLTGEFTLLAGLFFSLLFLTAGGPAIRFMTTDEGVRAAAITMLPYTALIPTLGGPSWLLDGIFIGATETRPMRNSALAVLLLYLATDWLLRPFGNHGVWIALLSTYATRAGSLLLCLPGLMRRHNL
ncbi:MAG: MATE family efflux transporter [Sphingobium sp.]